MKLILLLVGSLTFNLLAAQDKPVNRTLVDTLPYSEIPKNAGRYTAGNVAAQLIDALGFRFYWATEGLREKDLTFRADKDTRSTIETIAHIYEMSVIIKNATTQTINTSDQSAMLPFNEMRKNTLNNLKVASNILKQSTDEEMVRYTLKFKQEEKLLEFPFWNNINGPISDCLWHTGQIVSFRRLSGNPFSDKVNLLSGTVIR